MKIRESKLMFFVLLIGSFLIVTVPQQQVLAQEKVNSLEKYLLHCYCMSIGSTPDAVIELDNNGQILVECIPGKTVQQLTDGGI